MDEAVVGAAWYSPESWRQLEEAVAAAGLPKTILAGSYAEFVAAFDAQARAYARQGVRVEKLPVDVPHMAAFCKRWGLELTSVGRTKYGAALAAAGGDREALDRGGFVDRTRTEQ